MKRFLLAFSIAKTHMFSKLKQTIIASLGVTFGIAMFVFMMSFMNGVNKFLEDTMLSATPHIHIFSDVEGKRPGIIDEVYPKAAMKVVYHQRPKDAKKNLHNGFQIVESLKKDPNVLGVSPLLTSQVFYNFGPVQINGTIAGVDIIEEDKLYDLHSKVVAGRLENLFSASNGIIMGSGLAEKLNAVMGDKIAVTTPSGNSMTLTIVGLITTGIGVIDDAKSYALLSTAQKILQKDTRYITDINMKLIDLNKSKDLAKVYEAKFGYKAEDWETANATILVSFTLRNAITTAVVITLLTVAGFGIYNIMNMTIYEKMRDIAILKATGFNGGDVKRIFMSQALTIGLAGGLLGLLIGFLLSYMMSKVPFNVKGLVNLTHFPIDFNPKYYIGGILFGLLTTAFAGWFPSKKAGKIDPVEIIRGK